MITKIRIANFYSIGQELELVFSKGGSKDSESSGYFQYDKDKKVSLINGFFGANASGKSNVLKAIVTLIRLMYRISPTKESFISSVLCRPNLHEDFKGLPTKLGMDIIINDNKYQYDIEIKNGESIVAESLYVTTLAKKAAKPKKIFSRQLDDISFGADYRDHNKYLKVGSIQKYQTLISHLILNVGSKAVADFENHRLRSSFLKTDEFDITMPVPVVIVNSVLRINLLDKERQQEALNLTKEIMSCFDESIESLEINTDNNNISVKVKHQGFSGGLDLVQESAGTRELFCHVYDILSAFKSGGIVVYDETNRYFHPDIELTLLSLFKNKDFNKNKAQLFFASHNHDTFDLLELDQAYIVEKEKASSKVFKLSEIEGVTKRDNIKKKYRLGLLGGAPDTSLFDYKIKQLL